MAPETTRAVHLQKAVPQLPVPDVVKAAEHYRDVLGFEIAGYWDGEQASFKTEPPPVFAIVARDDVQVFFNRVEQPPAGPYAAYFHIQGVDALAEELRSRGADILDGPEDRVYGQRELVVQDCNGCVLTFAEAISGRATASGESPGRSSPDA